MISPPVLPLPGLFGMTLAQIEGVAGGQGFPSAVARRLAKIVYAKTDHPRGQDGLPAAVREAFQDRILPKLLPPQQVTVSRDGTRKYLFPTSSGFFVETAWIPGQRRATLCLSTQAGCRMGCRFCMTGTQGFQGQLTAGDILNQWRSLPERDTVTNFVLMGMGEPLDNLRNVLDALEILTASWGYAIGPRQITVSTAGLLPELIEFLRKSKCQLAISLHSPFEQERSAWMPTQTPHPIKALLKALKEYPLERQRRIFFEYFCIHEINDTPRHAEELARLLDGLRCRVNLMRFHPVPGMDFPASNDARLVAFQRALMDKGITTTLRRSRGRDIAAACGMLSTRRTRGLDQQEKNTGLLSETL